MRQPSVPVAQLPFNELKELQQLLVRAGFNVGKVDGVMGQLSRTAVKAMQVKYGLPADSWPTAELLARMRGPGAQAQPRRHGDAGGAVGAAVIPRSERREIRVRGLRLHIATTPDTGSLRSIRRKRAMTALRIFDSRSRPQALYFLRAAPCRKAPHPPEA